MERLAHGGGGGGGGAAASPPSQTSSIIVVVVHMAAPPMAAIVSHAPESLTCNAYSRFTLLSCSRAPSSTSGKPSSSTSQGLP